MKTNLEVEVEKMKKIASQAHVFGEVLSEAADRLFKQIEECRNRTHPIKETPMLKLVLVGIVLLMLLSIFSRSPESTPEPTAAEPVTEASEAVSETVAGTAGEELQQERRELIEKLMGLKVIQKISTPGTDPRVYVLPAFFALTFDEKQQFVSVCYAYAYQLPQGELGDFNETMWVFDGLSGKRIGNFKARSGLVLN